MKKQVKEKQNNRSARCSAIKEGEWPMLMLREKTVKMQHTRESVARQRMFEVFEEGLFQSQCHWNNITMLMRRPEKELVLCQALVSNQINPFFHPHSFIVHTTEGYYADYSFSETDYLCFSLVRLLRNERIKKARLFPRNKVLYWLNKTRYFGPYDKEHRLIEQGFVGAEELEDIQKIHDQIETDDSEEDCPLVRIASSLTEDKIKRWLPEEEHQLYQTKAQYLCVPYSEIGV
jgi:hypothetical protein